MRIGFLLPLSLFTLVFVGCSPAPHLDGTYRIVKDEVYVGPEVDPQLRELNRYSAEKALEEIPDHDGFEIFPGKIVWNISDTLVEGTYEIQDREEGPCLIAIIPNLTSHQKIRILKDGRLEWMGFLFEKIDLESDS